MDNHPHGRIVAALFLAGLVAAGSGGIVGHAIHAGDPDSFRQPAVRRPNGRVELSGVRRPPATEALASPAVLVAAPPTDPPRPDGGITPDDEPATFPSDSVDALPLHAPAAAVRRGFGVTLVQATTDSAPPSAATPADESPTRDLPGVDRDPDALEWVDAGSVPHLDPASTHRRGPVATWIRESFEEMRTSRGGVVPFPPRQAAAGGGRLIDRIRSGERLLGRDRPDARGVRETATEASGGWAHPATLVEQLDAAAREADSPAGVWARDTTEAVRRVLATGGPADPRAAEELAALHERIERGLERASATPEAADAAALRKVVLAARRREAVWSKAAAATALPAPADTGDSSASRGTTIAALLEAVERHESAASPGDAARIVELLESLDSAGDPSAADLAAVVREHYASANVRVAVHRKFVERVLPPTQVTSAPVEDTVLGRQVRGTSRVAQSTAVHFAPDTDGISVILEVRGQVASRTVTESGPVALTSRGRSTFTVTKPVTVDGEGISLGRTTGAASSRSQLSDIQTSFDGVPIMRSLVRNIARNQHDENLPEANREVIDKIVSRACREVDQQVEPRLREAAERIRTQAWGPLVSLGLDPTPVGLETTDGIAMARLRLAAEDQLAAFTPRPRAPVGSMVSVQVHESAVNNALERLGLAGRRLSLEELACLLCERAGVESRSPEDLPEDVTVSFARTQPLRVQYRDGLVHVRVALDAIESGRRDWHDVVASVTYRPKASDPQVFLEREGPVHIGGPGRQGRAEIALRAVFGKMFPKERPVPLVPESIAANPGLADLQVLQAVSTDGWLAISLGESPQSSRPAATKVAAPPQPRRGLRR